MSVLSPVKKVLSLSRDVVAAGLTTPARFNPLSRVLDVAHGRMFAPITPVPKKKTDIAVVMGGTATSRFVLEQAHRDWKDGKFEEFVLAGGALVKDDVLKWALRHFDKETFARMREADFSGAQIEAEYMRDILINEYRVDPKYISAAGEDQRHADGVIDSVLRNDFVKAADSMHLYGYMAVNRIRSTIRFQGEDLTRGAHGEDITNKQAFDGAVIPVVTGVGVMQPDNWKDSLIARVYVLGEMFNMMAKPFGGGYIGKYTFDPRTHQVNDDALIEALDDVTDADSRHDVAPA